MDRSVFLSDIDGTLVRGDVLPAPEVVQAADVFRAAGGLLSLCTGRSVEGARPVAESLSVDTPCVLYGGAALYDFSADRFLWSVPFSPHILDCMERFLREFPHLSLQVLTEQGSFVLRRNALLNAKGVRVENQGPEVPLSALPIPILKLVLCGENREELENCRRCFPPELCCFTFSSRHFVDVVSGETGKARAMAELAERLEIPLSQCLCAGDGMSDLPMLKQAGVAYVPANAPEEVRAAADLVIPAADSGGMAAAFLHGARWIHETMQHT